MRLLIDGYNLLFQSGVGPRKRVPGWVVAAREQLLKRLDHCLSTEWRSAAVVVFDKSQGNQSQLDFRSAGGIRVRFAIEHDEADDMLEELIRSHHAPKSLMVVSSDQRIRRQAKARRAQPVDSETFLRAMEAGDFLQVTRPGHKAAESSDGAMISQDEVDYWLRKFTDGTESQ